MDKDKAFEEALEFYQRMIAAAEFYEQSPDGQYDDIAAWAIRRLLVVVKRNIEQSSH